MLRKDAQMLSPAPPACFKFITLECSWLCVLCLRMMKTSMEENVHAAKRLQLRRD